MANYKTISRLLEDMSDPQITDFIGDYSITPVFAGYRPAPNKYTIINKMIISVSDVGAFDAGFYGNSINLTNGITFALSEGLVPVSIYNSKPIISNGDFGSYTHNISSLEFGQGANFLNVEKLFTTEPIILDGDIALETDLTLCAILNDDFSGLAHHTFLVSGFELDRNPASANFLRNKYGFF